jgi:hypothetical protein
MTTVFRIGLFVCCSVMLQQIRNCKYISLLLVWCYSECISTPGRLEKYAWPRWDSNIATVLTIFFGEFDEKFERCLNR